ncbi:aminotransferase-like domain-containing protein [Acetobacter fallax]|uniref:Aminotransferase class I/II-fold pyridoxal phosphate-dependent enzyme n=1 Tax=Acetobacter fallax TaxID=1737473 RepID=A0ABX0K7G4_9PROT|nr:PLP-dependent aminotransferase family protein [Acetobacter fallax]NHO31835.1 aminotransferase class I/II-fold pyridoxal phosphate-dependent enzyme [Acetobacter fallax]NHO35402.1 aminotransferase class I/II-fold pyridoxal phosphate-dependent enzyme [Acetobacter fallax]
MRLQSPWTPRLCGGSQPPAERLADALAEDILGGVLVAGDRLPAHRELAWRLGIGIGSVTRASAILERRGLVRVVKGRGTFVSARPGHHHSFLDLAANMPPPMFSDRALARTLTRLAKGVDPALFNVYPPVAGHLGHRRIMAHWLEELGLAVSPEMLLLTSGAQQALSVALAVARQSADVVITESLTYPGMLGAIRQTGMTLRGVAMDGGGMCPVALESVLTELRDQRAVLYLTPTMHNPTTATMERGRREDIVRLCRRFDALIIEDGVYVCVPDNALPDLVSLAPERTFHVSSLSKILSPGLRIGALIPPDAYREACLSALLCSSLMIAPLSYAMMAQWMQDGTAASVRQSLRGEAGRRRGLAASILGAWMVPPVYDAFHVWLPMLPEQTVAVINHARSYGVLVTDPAPFRTEAGSGKSGIRLCLGLASLPDLTEALHRVKAACLATDAKVSRDTIPVA